MESLLKDDQPGDIYPIDETRMVKRYNPTGESLYSVEKSILKKLDHPGAVKLLSKYTSGEEKTYFVLERPQCEIKRLSEFLLEKGGLEKDRFVNLALEMALVVNYLHDELHVL